MDDLLLTQEAHQLHRPLLRWYRRFARPLPWRKQPSLYGTWIAEIMLQQTTVQTVIPYWERFMRRFPDVACLAAASITEVLSHWSGLGYYRRAHALHQAARSIASERNGHLPSSRAEWLALPGIGPYTAGAIASIGTGEPVPAVDANARRVLIRWSCRTAAEARDMKPKVLEAYASQMVPRNHAGEWNQALMELGAQVCQPIRPLCHQCPVAGHCRAQRAGTLADVPPTPPRRLPTNVWGATLVARWRGAVLLWPADAPPAVRLTGRGSPVRSDTTGLWQGLLALPSSPWYREQADKIRTTRTGVADPTDLWRKWLAAFADHRRAEWDDLGLVKHAVTTYRLRVRVTEVVLHGRPRAPQYARWYHPGRQAEPPLSALARKVLVRAGLLG